MITDPAIHDAIVRFRLAHPAEFAARQRGELLGRATGSSHEFQDYREYRAGDDPRHIDWAAYARRDTPMVRLYRDETSPRMRIVLDGSRSMAAGSSQKPILVRQLASTLAALAIGWGSAPLFMVLGDNAPPFRLNSRSVAALEEISFTGRANPVDVLDRAPLPPGRLARRILISDFLFPHDPAQLIRRLAGDGTGLVLIQILAHSEIEPAWSGALRLVDVESGEFDDLRIDDATISAYKRRLAALKNGLAAHARQSRAIFVSAVAEDGLASICRDQLCSAGILQPA